MTNEAVKMITLPFEEYNEFISLYDANKDKWIYNILDGLAEQDKILYIDNKCIIIPTYTWSSPTTEDLKINPSCLDKLHILAIPFDRSIRCIRDLTFEHIPLLKHMKELTLKTINNLYVSGFITLISDFPTLGLPQTEIIFVCHFNFPFS